MEYQDFTKLRDYASFPLLGDTVTELVLEWAAETLNVVGIRHRAEEVTNKFAKLVKNLRYRIQEDPLRVIHPSCREFPTFRTIDMTELIEEEEIADGMFRVFHNSGQMPCIFKLIKRPVYQPHDTEVIQTELENLEYFRVYRGSSKQLESWYLPALT